MEGVDGIETRTKRGEDGPPKPGEVYYVLGPFGPISRVLAWFVGGIVSASALGSAWALWSIAGTLKDLVLTLKGR